MPSVPTQDAKPNVVRVTSELRRRILTQTLAPATKLPSIRQAAKREKVHPLTMAEAYRRLAAEGFVEIQPCVGAFVKDLPVAGEVLLCIGGPLEASSYATHISQRIGARETLGDASITVVRAASEKLAFLDAIRSRAERRVLRGCILGSLAAHCTRAALELLDQFNIPSVTLSYFGNPPVSVTHDECRAVRHGTRYLIEQGCRSVALISRFNDTPPWPAAEVCLATCEAMGVACRVPTLPAETWGPSLAGQEHYGAGLAEHILDSGQPCDGWLIMDDWIGRGAMTTLLRRGVRAPEQLKICTAAHVGDAYPDVFGMPVARLENDEARVAAAACELMEKLLAGEPLATPHIRIPLQLITPAQAASRIAAHDGSPATRMTPQAE